MARFPIHFDRLYAALSTALLILPTASFVEVDGPEVRAQMAWGFRTRFARSTIKAALPFAGHPISRGVHGWAGRWLVNGSGSRIVQVDLNPPQRAWVVGVPVKLRQLLVSVENPAAFIDALTVG